MDGLTFYKILRIIGNRYAGSTLNRISVLKDQLYFTLYHNGHKVLVFKSSPPPSLSEGDVAAGESHGVLASLNGAKLISTGGRPYDRLGWFDLEKRRPSGKLLKYRFILEPMGNYANAFLLNEEGEILFRLSTRSIDPDRDIGIGRPYTEPKSNKCYSLDNPGPETDFLNFTGFYPATANAANRYRDEAGLGAALTFLKEEINGNDWFYRDAKGKLFPFPPWAEAEKVAFEDILSRPVSGEEQPDKTLYINLRKFYTKQQQHYARLYEKLTEELKEALDYARYNQEADLIKANLHIIKGKGTFLVVDYSGGTMKEREYTYRQEEPPYLYADKLYKKAAKLKRSLPYLEERMTDVEQLRESAGEQLYYIETATPGELKEMAELLKKKPHHKKESKLSTDAFLRYETPEGIIYIGRNSASNHRLVFQFALPEDVWMHAQNIPSAHCIIRASAPLSGEMLLLAARLTASYSKNRREQRVPVDYTLKKHVKKPKNTPAGFVIYHHFKTLDVSPLTPEELDALGIQ